MMKVFHLIFGYPYQLLFDCTYRNILFKNQRIITQPLLE